VYNRGVDKRWTFADNSDRKRFLRGMYLFREKERTRGIPISKQSLRRAIQDPLVRIHHFSLMPNHYHFLLEQTGEQGVSKFMQRLGNGYTQYFNKRHDRSGSLFQSSYQVKHVDNDTYFLELSRYISLNCLDIWYPNWKKMGFQNPREALRRLRTFFWASYPAYSIDGSCLHLAKDKTRSFFEGKETFQDHVEKGVEQVLLSDSGRF